MKKSNKILVGILAFILTCLIGYALFSETVVVNGTLNASGNFSFKASCMNGLDSYNLDFIKKASNVLPETESGYENEFCNVSGNTVSFGANFKYPTAAKYYTLYFENTGTIDAIFNYGKSDIVIKNCLDENGDGKAEESCETNLQFTSIYPVSIIYNGNQCMIYNGDCEAFDLNGDGDWLIPVGAKLGLLAVSYWHPDLDEEAHNNTLIKMDTTIKFNFEQVTN